MSSVVSLSWIPVKKDVEGSNGAQALQGMKDKLLATSGLLHAYHGKSADPKEPTAIELIDGQILGFQVMLPCLETCSDSAHSLVILGRSQSRPILSGCRPSENGL